MNQPCSPSSAVVSFQSNKTWLNLSLAFLHGYLIFCRKIDFPFSGFCSALLISLFLPIHWKAETSANTPSPFKNLWDSILCHANAHSSLELQKSSPICRAMVILDFLFMKGSNNRKCLIWSGLMFCFFKRDCQ